MWDRETLLSFLHTLSRFAWHWPLQSTFWYSHLHVLNYWLSTILLRRYLSLGCCWKSPVKFRKHEYRAVKWIDHRLEGKDCLLSKWQVFQCFSEYKSLSWEDSHVFCLSYPGKCSTKLFVFRNASISWPTTRLLDQAKWSRSLQVTTARELKPFMVRQGF